jgi:hypothetical protein
MNVSALRLMCHMLIIKFCYFCYFGCVNFVKQTFFLLGFSEKTLFSTIFCY